MPYARPTSDPDFARLVEQGEQYCAVIEAHRIGVAVDVNAAAKALGRVNDAMEAFLAAEYPEVYHEIQEEAIRELDEKTRATWEEMQEIRRRWCANG